jgi:large conductance mechanosensitive channel
VRIASSFDRQKTDPLGHGKEEGFTMSFSSEFKEFALKGNVMDLAVGVIIGGAFGKIVDSFVGDLIMPIVGKIFGGLDFNNYFIPLAGQTATTLVEAKKAGAVFAYGSFVTILINFIILAFVIFMMVKQMNRMKREEPAAPPPPHARRRGAAARDPRLPEEVTIAHFGALGACR